MKIFSEPVEFEWDKGNIEKNVKKHKVSITEVEEVFDDKSSFIFEDEKHSGIEKCFGLFGKTKTGRVLSIVFTMRLDKVRVVTARDISKKERRGYEKIKKNTDI